MTEERGALDRQPEGVAGSLMEGKCPGATDDRRPDGRLGRVMGLGDLEGGCLWYDESMPWRLIEAEGIRMLRENGDAERLPMAPYKA
jgi:hypothetical protein